MPTNTDRNTLFPVFLKLENLKLLIVGAGPVGLEKLEAIFNNSPEANVRIVAKEVIPQVQEIVSERSIDLDVRDFEPSDLQNINIVILATNNIELDAKIKAMASVQGIIMNVADKPALCDFYMSSIVQKGDLKIAISTNGKSPTIAKRIKESLNQAIPDDVNSLLQNMQKIRNKLVGDFEMKVNTLNKLTANWSSNDSSSSITNKV